jgi:hypothetical protein
VIAIQDIVTLFNTQMIPLVICIFPYVFSRSDKELGLLLDLTLISNVVSVASLIFCIFVEWKKGSPWWVRFAPYIFFVQLVITFFVIPMINIFVSLYVIITA